MFFLTEMNEFQGFDDVTWKIVMSIFHSPVLFLLSTEHVLLLVFYCNTFKKDYLSRWAKMLIFSYATEK